MKKRPLVIKLIALGYLLTPVSFIVQYFIFSKSSIFQASTWMTLLTPYKLSLIIIPPIVAFGVFKMRQWGWYLSLVHMFFILGNNTLSFLVGSRTPPWAIIIFSLVTLVVLLTIVRKEIRAPYFNPKVRWWEAKPRYAMVMQVEMGNDRMKITGETFNISEGGMFMVSPSEVKIDEKFNINLMREKTDSIYCEGRIVWVNPSGEALPQGFGFQFTQIDQPAILEIRRYIKDQKKVLKDKTLMR